MTKKGQKKRGDAPRQANIALKARSLEHFSRKLSIFGRFWGPFGDQIGLQNGSQYYKIGFWFHLGAPGRSNGPFWVDFGSILGAFWGLWGALWHHSGATQVAKSSKPKQIQGSGNKQQPTAANSRKQQRTAVASDT